MGRRASLRQLKRRPAVKAPRLRILLVCEGEKTERLYFSLYLTDLRAANVSLEIAKKACGSDPLGIVRYAKERMKADRGLDQCYCIIDRDSHVDFNTAVKEAEDYQTSLGKDRLFITIKSFPCFEYWFLLHFEYTTSPFAKEGNRSPADVAIKRLKQHLPGYKKSDGDVIASLLPKTATAVSNSRKSLKHALTASDFNPSTEVHVVVELLQSFA